MRDVLWHLGGGEHVVAGLSVYGARFFLATESPSYGTRGPAARRVHNRQNRTLCGGSGSRATEGAGCGRCFRKSRDRAHARHDWPASYSTLTARQCGGPVRAHVADRKDSRVTQEAAAARERRNRGRTAAYAEVMRKRPLAVSILSCLFIATGVVGLARHLADYKATQPFEYDLVWIFIVELAAIVCGAFMLRGTNWARWLALAWMALPCGS